MQLVAVLVAEERALVGGRQIDLAHEDRVTPAAAHEAAQVAHEVVGVGERALRHADRLEQERHRVHPEPGETLREPVADDLGDLVADLGGGDVQVRLVRVEAVQVPLARLLVIGPVRLLLVREDHVAGLLRGLLVGPYVEVVERRVAIAARPEPRVLVGGVVDHEVGHDPDPAVARGPDHLGEVARRAEPAVDAVEVGDVVAVVALFTRVERHQPQAAHAQPREVVEPVGQALEVAAAVAVRVQERLDVEAVDNRVLPPHIAGRLGAHSAGRTCSPKASMNRRCSWPT